MPCFVAQLRGLIIGATALWSARAETGPTSVGRKKYRGGSARSVEEFGPEPVKDRSGVQGCLSGGGGPRCFLVNERTRNPARSPATGDAEPGVVLPGVQYFSASEKSLPSKNAQTTVLV